MNQNIEIKYNEINEQLKIYKYNLLISIVFIIINMIIKKKNKKKININQVNQASKVLVKYNISIII